MNDEKAVVAQHPAVSVRQEGTQKLGHGLSVIGVADFQKQVVDEAGNFAEYDSWDADENRVYTTPDRDTYTVRVRDLEGTHVFDYTRPFTPRTRADEDKEEYSSGGAQFRVSGQDSEVERKILDTDPAIDDLQVASDGRLFIRTCWDARELLPDGTADRYDVISPEGEFLEQVGALVRIAGVDVFDLEGAGGRRRWSGRCDQPRFRAVER